MIIDTGPIIAFLDRKDKYHAWANKIFSEVTEPFYTCEAIMVEAFFLAKKISQNMEGLFTLLDHGALIISFSLQDEWPSVSRFIKLYKNVPCSLADACLVRMAELYEKPVLTLDANFQIYRYHKHKKIPLVHP